MTKAEFARLIGGINRLATDKMAAMSDGMWNPDFCRAACAAEALAFCEQMSDRIQDIRARVRKAAS